MQARDNQSAYQDADAVLGALERGVGRQARTLEAPMPRYAFTPEEERALLAYLRVLATDADPVPGLKGDRIVVASVLPLSGPQAWVGEQVHAALTRRFNTTNAAGGVFGRRIELRVFDAGPDAASASLAARNAWQASGDGIFAFVGSLLPEPDAALRALLWANDVPMVATLGVPHADVTQPQLTYLLPSINAQVRRLVAELSTHCGGPNGEGLVLHPPGAALSRELASELPGLRVRSVADDAQIDAAVRTVGRVPVVALLAPHLIERVRAQLQAASATACLGTLAVVSGPPSSEAGRAVPEVLALPMPPLAEERSAVPGATLWAVLGDTAAQVFVEALARSGRGVDTARFARALDSLHRFQPAVGLSVTFSPTQRHGFDMTYLWRENPHETTRR